MTEYGQQPLGGGAGTKRNTLGPLEAYTLRNVGIGTLNIGAVGLEKYVSGIPQDLNPIADGEALRNEGKEIFTPTVADWAINNPEFIGYLSNAVFLGLDNPIFTRVFPIEYQTENDFTRDVMRFNRDFADISVLNTRPREIGFTMDTVEGSLEFSAQAMKVSRKRLNLPGGVALMNLVLDAMASNAAAALILRANAALFSTPEYTRTPEQLYPNCQIPTTPWEVLEWERRYFGAINRRPMAIRDLINDANAVLAPAGAPVGNVILTREDKFFIKQMDRANISRDFAGDAAMENRESGAKLDFYNGVAMVEVPLIGTTLHNQLDQNLFAQPVQNGSFAVYDSKAYCDVPPEDYHTYMSTIAFCDWTDNTWHEYPLAETLRHTFEFVPLDSDVRDQRHPNPGYPDLDLLVNIATRLSNSNKIDKQNGNTNYNGHEHMVSALLKFKKPSPASVKANEIPEFWHPVTVFGEIDSRLVPTEHFLFVARVLHDRIFGGAATTPEGQREAITKAFKKMNIIVSVEQVEPTITAPSGPVATEDGLDNAIGLVRDWGRLIGNRDAMSVIIGTIQGLRSITSIDEDETLRSAFEAVTGDSTYPSGDILEGGRLATAMFERNTEAAREILIRFNIITDRRTNNLNADQGTKFAACLLIYRQNIDKYKTIDSTLHEIRPSFIRGGPEQALEVLRIQPPAPVGRPNELSNSSFLQSIGGGESRSAAAKTWIADDPDYKSRMKYAATLPSNLAAVFEILLVTDVCLQNIVAFDTYNIPQILNAFIARPWEMQLMHSFPTTTIPPIGKTLVGIEGIQRMITFNPTADEYLVSGEIRSASKVFNNRGLHILRYVRGGQLLGGKGNEFINTGVSRHLEDEWETSVINRIGRGDLLQNRSNIAVLQGVSCPPAHGMNHFDIRGQFDEIEFGGRRMDFAAYRRRYEATFNNPVYVGQAVVNQVLRLSGRPRPRVPPVDMSFRQTRRLREHNYVVSKTNVRMYDFFAADHVKYTQSHHMWGDQLPRLRELESSERPVIIAEHLAAPTIYANSFK